MESCAEGAEGHVEFGGKDEEEERGLEVHIAIEQAEANFYSDDGGAESGEQFKRKRGEKGDSQNAEGGISKLFTDFFNGASLRFGLAEEFEGGESLQAVEKVRAQKSQGFVLAFGDSLGAFANDDHEEWNQRGSD